MSITLIDPQNVAALQILRSMSDVDGRFGSTQEKQISLSPQKINEQLCPPFETFGAFRNEILVGAASLSRMPDSSWDPDAANWFAISAVMVHPNHRGFGYGKALVVHCLDRVAQQCGKGVLLEVNVPNPAAKALYDNLGFEVWNVYEGAYEYGGTWFDRVSMKKLLL
jgi:ribosomal protein S18 acetylase RimI-like enzyme